MSVDVACTRCGGTIRANDACYVEAMTGAYMHVHCGDAFWRELRRSREVREAFDATRAPDPVACRDRHEGDMLPATDAPCGLDRRTP